MSVKFIILDKRIQPFPNSPERYNIITLHNDKIPKYHIIAYCGQTGRIEIEHELANFEIPIESQYMDNTFIFDKNDIESIEAFKGPKTLINEYTIA